MPPEQAMGGKVTTKADLYSLGAMLYEIVMGRPPFVGDDSVSIIGQHINTSPISPSWHRADITPAFETLILQLLEKDPEKRPASAGDVLQALESIDAGKISKEASREASTITENPLYRRVFVGRESELKQLQSAFDGAVSGQSALMMVVGEPGIGKMALCEQLKTYVILRGGKTLLGHCYEEGIMRYAKPDTSERAWADYLLTVRKYFKGRINTGRRLINQAIDTARRTVNQYVLMAANAFLLHISTAPQNIEKRNRLADELWANKDDWRKIAGTTGSWYVFGDVFLSTAQRQRAEEVFDDLRTVSERTARPRFYLQSLAMDAVMALMDGRLGEALEITKNARTRGEEASLSSVHVDNPEVRTCVYPGESLDTITRNIPPGIPFMLPELCIVLAHLGRKEEASEILEKCVVQRPNSGTDQDDTRFWFDVIYLEAAVLANHRKSAELLLGRLRGIRLCTTGVRFATCLPRHLGGTTSFLGRYDEACQYYQEAIKVCTEMPFRPELALTHL